VSRLISIRPRAQLDILEQAEYYADRATIELAFRFQEACEATFRCFVPGPSLGAVLGFATRSLRAAVGFQ
jgi:hypothetical protein